MTRRFDKIELTLCALIALTLAAPVAVVSKWIF
jgi:hypothetical protein